MSIYIARFRETVTPLMRSRLYNVWQGNAFSSPAYFVQTRSHLNRFVDFCTVCFKRN